MPFTWNDIGYGFGVPVLTSLFLLVNLRWMLPTESGRRYAPAIAFVAAFQVGYWLLKLGPVQPEGHWQWLPHFLLMTAIIGSISASRDLHLIDRLLLYSLATFAAAVVLVPTWEDLDPPRLQYLCGWSVMVVVNSLLLDGLVGRSPGKILPCILFLTCTSGAVLLTHSGSLLFGQVGIAATGGVLGVWIAALFDKNSRNLDGISFPVMFFLCGSMLIGHVNSFSSIPIYAYGIIPFAPLGLWLTSGKKMGRFKGLQGIVVQLLLPVLICLTALGLAFWFEPLAK